MSPAILAALLLLQAAGAPVRSAGGKTVSSQELAQSLNRKLEDIEAQRKAGKPQGTVVVTDAELNAYLNLIARLPPSLSGVDIRFERERVAARGLLDLDQLQGRIPGSLGGFSLLSGKVAASVKGRLVDQEGFGSFEIEDVRLGSIPISTAVLGQIVASATRNADRPEGIDILAPFRYPYSVRRVRLQPGRAVLEF